jgi:hypothetical protein
MLRRVAPVWTDLSEERIASIIMVKIIGDIGKVSAVTKNWILCSVLQFIVNVNVVPNSLILVTLKMMTIMTTILSSEMSVFARSTRRHAPEDAIS